MLPQVVNHTELVAEPLLLLSSDGPRLTVVAKATFELWPEGPLELAPPERQRAVRHADIPWDEETPASLALPCDAFVSKPGTDVVAMAVAHAVHGEPCTELEAGVKVGSMTQTLRVLGPRVWEASGAAISTPTKMTSLDLRFDYAWGGYDDSDPDNIVEEAYNPVGRGVARDPATLSYLPAPRIENPTSPVRDRSGGEVAGIGVVGRHWSPRREFTGTHDATWLAERAPLPPADYNPRFACCAVAALHQSKTLKGGEPVALLNLLPGGGTRTARVPNVAPEIELATHTGPCEPVRPELDMVVIDTACAAAGGQPACVELIWRAVFLPPHNPEAATVIVRERRVS